MSTRDRKSLAIFNLDNSNLNSQFTIEKLREGIKFLKNGKASGHDKIVNGMLKASDDMMLSAYVKLFNITLDTGYIRDNWTIGIIRPIFKIRVVKMIQTITEEYLS